MNIDLESIGLLSLIIQDSPKDQNLVVCVLARSNAVPNRINFHTNTEYPTFYGYYNSRIPLYLMGKGVLSDVPREGYSKRLISAGSLSLAEAVINRAKSWDKQKKLDSVAKFIKLDNRTAYKDAEVFLMYRDKASAYIKEYALNNEYEVRKFLGVELSEAVLDAEVIKKSSESPTQSPYWQEDFSWLGYRIVFGKYGETNLFNSPVRRSLLKKLTDARGGWVTVEGLKKATEKDDKYVRSTIKQIEHSLPKDLKEYVSFPSTVDDDLQPKPEGKGAYRLRFIPQSS